MSVHTAKLSCGRKKRYIVAGFDRPLQAFFLNVYRGDRADPDRQEFTSLEHCGPGGWADPHDALRALSHMGLTVPATLAEALQWDQKYNVGNRVVEHHRGMPANVVYSDDAYLPFQHVVVEAKRKLLMGPVLMGAGTLWSWAIAGYDEHNLSALMEGRDMVMGHNVYGASDFKVRYVGNDGPAYAEALKPAKPATGRTHT